MRTLVHISDLHFGRTDDEVVGALAKAIRRIKPDLVVVSGDLTQRARSRQFRAARAFLDSLPFEKIVVPGNHDVPMFNFMARFFHPLKKYRRFITTDLMPVHIDDEIAVVGLSTARSLVVKNGRVNDRQIARAGAHFAPVPEDVVRVVVTHHPFDLDPAMGERKLVRRAEPAMRAFAEMGVDLLLAGHVHLSRTGTTAARYQLADYSAVAVQAGTATSTRLRHEVNSFNIIRIQSGRIEIAQQTWRDKEERFKTGKTTIFVRAANRWEES